VCPKILCVFFILLALPATACGPAAHAYIAMRVLGTESGPALVAAALPDLNGAFRGIPGAEGRIKHLTHFEFARMAPSTFAAGFATHNGEWGADSMAHAFLREEDDGYFTGKLRALSERCGITIYEAEDLFDGAVEMVLAREVGASLGQALKASARAMGRAEEDALVLAFAGPLAESTTLTGSEADTALRWAHRSFKTLMTAYGTLLQQDLLYQKGIAVRAMTMQFGWSPGDAHERMNAALELAADCLPALDAMADALRAEIRSRPEWAPFIVAP
jgi:hypothetical protein